jgi:hypothetical protein
MSTFVLVHGAFHGGWCWREVTAQLRASGHAVFTSTLTGLGQRSHLAAPTVDLSTHVRDVANCSNGCTSRDRPAGRSRASSISCAPTRRPPTCANSTNGRPPRLAGRSWSWRPATTP